MTEPEGNDYLNPVPVPRTDPKPEPTYEPFGAIVCAPELRHRLLARPSEFERQLANLLDGLEPPPKWNPPVEYIASPPESETADSSDSDPPF